jgi:hypothetical protein
MVTYLGVMERKTFCQMFNMSIGVDVVENVGDESIFLVELAPIIQQISTFFECESEVANDLSQRCQVIFLRPKPANGIFLQTIVGLFGDRLDDYQVVV